MNPKYILTEPKTDQTPQDIGVVLKPFVICAAASQCGGYKVNCDHIGRHRHKKGCEEGKCGYMRNTANTTVCCIEYTHI